MRIAIVAHSDAPWTPHYARACLRAGHDVTVISFVPTRLDGIRTAFVGKESRRDGRRKHLYLARILAIRKLLRRVNPDVVFAPYLISNGLAAALAWRGPLVVSARGADILPQPGSLGVPRWVVRFLARFISARARVVHVVSEELSGVLLSWGVPASKIECFPVGVDTTLFVPSRSLSNPVPVRDIICTRSHEPVYENHVIIEALAILRKQNRSFRCTFVGSGKLLDAHRARAVALDLDDAIRFVPRVDHARVPSLLQEAEIYVSASSSDGTSSSLLEAMATGLFPVVTRIPANEAWISQGDTGLLFDVGDHEGLARALARGMNDAPLRARAREANRRLVELKGNLQVNNRRLMGLLAQAAHEQPRSPE